MRRCQTCTRPNNPTNFTAFFVRAPDDSESERGNRMSFFLLLTRHQSYPSFT